MYRQILVHPDEVDYQRILWLQYDEAFQPKPALVALMNREFELRKWISNVPELLNDIPLHLREQFSLTIKSDESHKILGFS